MLLDDLPADREPQSQAIDSVEQNGSISALLPYTLVYLPIRWPIAKESRSCCHLPRIFVISLAQHFDLDIGEQAIMLQALSEEIRLCFRRAEDCAHQAKTASTEELRANWLRYEAWWLGLARNRESEQRIDEQLRRSGTPRVRPPSLSQTDKGGDGLVAIVDDDEYAREGLRALIESLGHRAVTFTAVEEYLASRITESTACLMLDVHLPGMSGPDLQAHLIAEGCCPPIVFVTGQFEENVQKRVIAAGAFGYLRKSCNEKALLDCIESALGAMR